MNTQIPSFDEVIAQRIESDTDFQASILDLTDDEKATKLAEKRSEVMSAVWSETATEKAKFESDYQNAKTRAEKAEALAKDNEGKLSPEDALLLMQNNVHREDIAELQRTAKILGVGLEDALKDSVTQTILQRRADARKAALAANIKNVRGGSGGPSDTEILNDLSSGKVPEPGSAEAERLFFARRGQKK